MSDTRVRSDRRDGPRGFGNIVSERLHEPVAGRKRRLAQRFCDFGAPIREFLEVVRADDDIHCSPVDWLPETAWRAERIVLIGDAAHAMPPMMGQGGRMAFEDALVLAEEFQRGAGLAGAPRSL